ncbi:DUF3343 domain-containing protein [Thermodesulfobacteriota bacterium]
MFKSLKKIISGSELTTGKDRGFFLFDNTSEVIQAEKLLKKNGWKIRVMGPPPEIRKGCDMVIEFPLIEGLNALRLLSDSGLIPIDIVPVNSPLLKPVDLYHTKDFGGYLMVRAANMKLTVDKSSLIIVNISGGGCPDVPFMAQEMIGKNLYEAPDPEDMGLTLCGYALKLAYKEIKKKCLR